MSTYGAVVIADTISVLGMMETALIIARLTDITLGILNASVGGADIGQWTNGKRKEQMMRLIDADAMVESIKTQSNFIRSFGRDDINLMANVIEEGFLQEIENAPTIEAVPVRKGKWIRDYKSIGKTWNCSECRCLEFGDEEYLDKFCPNCGADMRGKQDGNQE